MKVCYFFFSVMCVMALGAVHVSWAARFPILQNDPPSMLHISKVCHNVPVSCLPLILDLRPKPQNLTPKP